MGGRGVVMVLFEGGGMFILRGVLPFFGEFYIVLCEGGFDG